MKLCCVEYGDFIIWNENELVIPRVDIDEGFIDESIRKVTLFYKHGVLPELVGKYFTRETPGTAAEGSI